MFWCFLGFFGIVGNCWFELLGPFTNKPSDSGCWEGSIDGATKLCPSLRRNGFKHTNSKTQPRTNNHIKQQTAPFSKRAWIIKEKQNTRNTVEHGQTVCLVWFVCWCLCSLCCVCLSVPCCFVCFPLCCFFVLLVVIWCVLLQEQMNK